MVKVYKIKPVDKAPLTREAIAKIGQSLYLSDDIKAVKIRINFKDGSAIGFKRSEEQDTMEDFIEEMEDD